ncbi:hypothetical protein EST38_g8448 [Candolleomyces aberdarensis]|uniref:Uncharacterized protein n=1 Tax=Candolleomyces aberdarensis TaxID=2316362 RepID=A0A4Q2DFC9_9AGAR|nr:hypothetical protein EST38_g8448 [Candolleomyces aberdarensis]
MLRTAATNAIRANSAVLFGARRQLHQTPIAAKNVKETVGDVAHDVNIKIGQGLASAIEKGEEVAQATKETLEKTKEEANQAATAGEQKYDEAKSQTQKAANIGKQKFNQAAAGAKEGKEDFKREVSK